MTDQKKIRQKITKQNVLESLKDLGTGAVGQTGDLLKSTSEDFFRELMGVQRMQVKRSGEIGAGESLQMGEVLSGREEENKKLRMQIGLERQLSADEKRVSQSKTNELKVQLQALISEVQKVAASTGNLAKQTEIAAIQKRMRDDRPAYFKDEKAQ
ncbi:MAG: hypothetical protein UX13_C0022G0019, partial [Candidatus Woesebacteria bacterium GW2011_GWB1_45_5]